MAHPDAQSRQRFCKALRPRLQKALMSLEGAGIQFHQGRTSGQRPV